MGINKFLRQAKRPLLVTATIVGILLLVSFVVFLLYSKWLCRVKLTESISPIEVINVFLTAFIAVWLGRYVTKRLTEQRFIKEFVIADIYKIEESLTALERLTLADKLDIETIFQSLQILRSKIEILQKTTEIAGIENSEINNLKVLHTNIFNATTNSDGNEVDIASNKNEIQVLYQKFILSLRRIICHINKQS